MLRLRRTDEGSLPMVMLLTIVGLGVSVVMATSVAGEQKGTKVATQRDAALNAAQSGLDAALANIRVAVRADGSGNPAKLPCTAVTGATGSDGSTAYSVSLYYLLTKPPSGDAAWAQANKLTCTPGMGPASLPAYAMIVSVGTAGTTTTSRTLTGTYALTSSVQNTRIAGGLVKAYSDTGGNICLTAGNAPAIGTQLAVETCDATKAGQQFMWQSGLTIGLKGTTLCADGRTSGADFTEKAGNRVTLQTCTTDPVPRQQWSTNDHNAFYGTSNGTTVNNFCWNTVSNKIVLADKVASAPICEDGWIDSYSFFPAADFGSGRAGADTGQLVNSDQFGRCIDVTSDDVNSDYLVVFPCKQSVTGVVLWNQTWQLPTIPDGADSAVGYIYTIYSGTKYCLQSPGLVSTADRGDGSPKSTIKLVSCTPTGVPPAALAWNVYADTGRSTTSYRIESTYNSGAGTYCLAAADPTGPAVTLWATANLVFSKLVLVSCSGSDLQKWNTSPLFFESTLSDVTEK